MRLFTTWLVLTCASAKLLAQTYTNETRRMSLEDCIEVALRHNLDVQIQRLNPEIARLTLKGMYGSYEPTLSISGQHLYDRQPGSVDANGRAIPGAEIDVDSYNGAFSGLLPWGTTYNLGIGLSDQTTRQGGIFFPPTTLLTTNTFFDATHNQNISLVSTNILTGTPSFSSETYSGQAGFLQLRQPLLKNFWVDSTRLQIFLDKKSLQSSELDLVNQVMTSVTAVEQAYYDLVSAQETVKVQEKALELAERLTAENKKRVEVGALAPLDEKQSESQAATSRADLIAARNTEDIQQRTLKVLLSDDYSQWQRVRVEPTDPLVAVPETFDLQESWRRGLKLRPDLIKQKVSLEKQGYVLKFNKNQLYPQLDLVGSYGYNASSPNIDGYLDQFRRTENPFYSVGAQLTIPLLQTTARYNYKLNKATRDQIELQLKQLEQNILVAIENAVATARTDLQRVEATREARVYAEAALDAEQKKLDSGKSTSFIVLQFQRDLTTARSAEISALAAYNKDLAQIALNEGSTLERRKVSIEKK
jgi:outer membrane protein